jgi:hypothetical protein
MRVSGGRFFSLSCLSGEDYALDSSVTAPVDETQLCLPRFHLELAERRKGGLQESYAKPSQIRMGVPGRSALGM